MVFSRTASFIFSSLQIQVKMSMIHQELQNLKHQLDSGKHRGSEHDLKLMKKIENLKEQFREYLVEVRKRKAAQTETAMFLSEDDSTVSSKCAW